MTRHKLDIPEEFLPILSDAHRAINGKEVKVIQYYGDYCFVNSDEHSSVFNHAKVFVSWLTEIKEEPVSAKEYCNTSGFPAPPPNQYGAYLGDLKKAFQAGEQNNELRHRETFSFEDWHSKHGSSDKELDSMVWQACKESHNLT